MPDIEYEPAEVSLPSIQTTTIQSYQFFSDGSNASSIVDFINFFTHTSGHAVESEGTVVWTYSDTVTITIEPGEYVATDQQEHVWVLDEDNFGAWMNG